MDEPNASLAPGVDPAEGRSLYGADPEGYAAGRPEYPSRVYELLADQIATCHPVRMEVLAGARDEQRSTAPVDAGARRSAG